MQLFFGMYRRLVVFVVSLWVSITAYAAEIDQYTPTNLPFSDLQDINGKIYNIEEFEGNVILLHFWASWCSNCVAEMKQLDQLQKSLRKEPIIIIPISEDFKGNEVVKEFYKNHHLKNLLSFVDAHNEIFAAFDAHNLPTSYIIDTEGKHVTKIIGSVDWNAPDMVNLLRSHIQPKSSVNADYMNTLKQQNMEVNPAITQAKEIPPEAITEIAPIELSEEEQKKNDQDVHFSNIQQDNFSLKVRRPPLNQGKNDEVITEANE